MTLNPGRPAADATGMDGPRVCYALHGLVTIDAPRSSPLERRFGPFRGPGPGDLVIEEVPPRPREVQRCHRWGGGIAPDRPPSVLDGMGRRAVLDVPAWVEDRATLVHERGFDPAFLFSRVLVPALRVRLALRRRAVLLRAAGYRLHGEVVAVAGWTGAGKTTRLLEALSRGAEFLGDDWLIVDERGWAYPFVASFGLPDRLLLEHPTLRRGLPLRARVAFGVRQAIRAAALRAAGRGASATARAVRWASEVGIGTAWIRSTLADLLPDVRIGEPGPLDRLVVLDRRPGDLPRRLAAAVGFELARDLRALEYLLPPPELALLDAASEAEREVVAGVCDRVRVVGADGTGNVLPLHRAQGVRRLG